MEENLLRLEEPEDYFKGKGNTPLPVPTNVLLFLRKTKETLQQKALQNRSHHRFVLIFNYETEGCVHLDNQVLRLKPGQAMLVMPYQFHHYSRLSSDDLKWLFCTFELSNGAFVEPLRNRVVNSGDKTKKSIENLLFEWQSPAPKLQAEQIQAALLQLLLSLSQDLLSKATDLQTAPTDSLLRSVNQLLVEWRGRTVVVADLAKALGLSESRLRVVFRKSAGVSLGEYAQNFRINRSMALLKTTDLPITDIAIEAGFGSPQAFSRIFRKKTGYTPRAYRKR